MKQGRDGRRFRRAGVFLMAAVVLFAAVGCGKKATPQNLLADMQENAKDMKAVEATLKMGMSMSDGSSKMEMGIDIDMESTMDPQELHMDGEIKINISGLDMGTDIEVYQVKEDSEDIMYINLMNEWMRSKTDTAGQTFDFKDMDTMKSLAKLADQFELAEKPVEVEGKECFELTGVITGDIFKDVMNKDFLDSFGVGELIDEDDIAKMEVPCTIDISREDILPVRMYMDMKDAVGAVGGNELGDVTVDEYYMEILYTSFNKTDKIEVPANVKESATNVTEDLEDALEEDLENGLGGGTGASLGSGEPLQRADQSTELGATWDSYTVEINDKVLTFPCTIADVEEAGIKLDTDYTPLDTVVSAGDYELGFFMDDKGNEVAFEISNSGSADLPLNECLVTGITIGDYDLSYGGLTVVLPGGVQMGMTKEEVLAIYGETEDVYEGETQHMYTWSDPNDFYKYCEIDFDASTGKVVSMVLTCTEF